MKSNRSAQRKGKRRSASAKQAPSGKTTAKKRPHAQRVAGSAPAAGERPSIETVHGWLWVRRTRGRYPEATERSGKWLVFASPDQIDALWKTIGMAVQAGHLGESAKVSTAHRRAVKKSTQHVICVYTYDSDDVEDVRRIRTRLRELGITRPIPYKTDAATHRDGDASIYEANRRVLAEMGVSDAEIGAELGPPPAPRTARVSKYFE